MELRDKVYGKMTKELDGLMINNRMNDTDDKFCLSFVIRTIISYNLIIIYNIQTSKNRQ